MPPPFRAVALASALRAGLTYLPGAETRPVAGLVRVLEVRAPDPKRPTAPIDLPDAAPPAADFFPSEDFGGEDGDARTNARVRGERGAVDGGKVSGRDGARDDEPRGRRRERGDAETSHV